LISTTFGRGAAGSGSTALSDAGAAGACGCGISVEGVPPSNRGRDARDTGSPGENLSHMGRLTVLPPEDATYRIVCAGFPLLTLGLILGSYWGKQAWGDYWGWDPKELWSLASWLVFLGYFHFRYMFGKKHPRINSLWAIAGMAAIIITLLWVNLSRIFSGLHSYAT
jgi:hypothetical protein